MKFEFNTKYYLIPSICTSLAIVSIMIYFYLKLDSDNYSIKFRLKYHTDSVSCLVALKNGDLASGSNDKSIIIWDLSKKEVNYKLLNHTSGITSLTQLTNGDLVSGSADGQIIKWKFDTKESRYFMELILREHDDNIIWSLLSLDDGHKLASSDNDRTIRIWDFDTKSHYRLLKLNDSAFSLALLDINHMVCGLENGDIAVWNFRGIKPIIAYKLQNQHMSTVISLVLLENGDLVSGSHDKTIIVWDMSKKMLKYKLEDHDSSLVGLALLSNNDLVSASQNGRILVWNLMSENASIKLEINSQSMIRSLTVLDDDEIVTGIDDNSLIVWIKNRLYWGSFF